MTDTIWASIPQAQPNDLIGTVPASSTSSTSSLPAKDASNDLNGLLAISESSTVGYGQSSSTATSTYYSTTTNPYSNSYTMYASANPSTYYQQMASSIRAQQTAAAAGFPYNLAATQQYYTTPYQIDYSTYNQQYYRNNYYNPLNSFNALSVAGDSATSVTDTPVLPSNGFQIKEKKVKAKKKKTGSCSPGDETYTRVFIWDIDDIAGMSQNLCLNISQNFPHLAPSIFLMRTLLERVVATNFSDPSEVQEGDVINIEDAVVDESVIDGPIDNLRGLDIMRRVAPKFASLKQFYQEISIKQDDGFKMEKLVLNYELLERCGLASQEAELTQSTTQLQGLFDNRWQTASRCLELVSKRSAESNENYANVVISGDGIVHGAAQLLVSGYSSSVPIENIYSTLKAAKESIFEKIQSRYGKKCSFVLITSVNETASIAKKLSIPVWPVTSSDCFDRLFSAQRDYLLA